MESINALFAAGCGKNGSWNFSVQSMFENMNECVCIIDVEGYVKYWNNGGVRLYGIRPEEIFNNKIQAFFPNALGPTILKSRKPVCHVEHRPKEGSVVLISAAPIVVDGIVRGVITIDYDANEFHFDGSNNARILRHADHLECVEKIVKRSQQNHSFDSILSQSRQMSELVYLAHKVAKTDATIIITGESGTGKDLFARAIHLESERKDGPFIIIDCSTISESLIESEFFGYESGAFTGALKAGKPGKFELADGGTVFLDEIGELPLEMQSKLLRVLENREFYRINGTKPVDINVRIIAATNRNIEQMVQDGTFRRDLFYRLSVFSLHIPPLRERVDDILLLVDYYLKYYSVLNHKVIDRIAPKTMNILRHYNWPGNVRELRNVIERLVILAEDNEICVQDAAFLENEFKDPKSEDAPFNTFLELEMASLEVQRETILKALSCANYNMVKAAKLLGIPRSTLYYKIEKLHISPVKCKRGRPLRVAV
jgi:transcriptional regulator with PAS, ATPase and Fis domain